MRIILCIAIWLLSFQAQASAIYEWQNVSGSHVGSLEISDAAYAAGHVSFATPRFVYPTEPYAPGDIVQFHFDAAGFGPSFINGQYGFDLTLAGSGLSGQMNVYGLETTVLMSAEQTLWTIGEYRTDIFGHCYIPLEDCSGDTGRWLLTSAPGGVSEPSDLVLLTTGLLWIGRWGRRRRLLVSAGTLLRGIMAVVAFALAMAAMATAAPAATITIDTALNEYRPGLENQGWWPPTIGYSNNTESDYHLVGWSTPGFSDTEVRSFFSFYLDPALLDHAAVTNATFLIRKGGSGGDSPQETLGLFDVTSPLATVMHNVSTNFAVWTDLGTGTIYGSGTFPVGSNPDDVLSVSLDSAALAAINADIGGYFTIGAAVTSGDGFFFRDNPGSLGVQALVLETAPVHEPSIISLFVMVAGGLAYRHRQSMGR